MEQTEAPLDAELIGIIDTAWKLWKVQKLSVSEAIKKACAETKNGNKRFFEVCSLFRKVGGRFGNLRSQNKSRKPVFLKKN